MSTALSNMDHYHDSTTEGCRLAPRYPAVYYATMVGKLECGGCSGISEDVCVIRAWKTMPQRMLKHLKRVKKMLIRYCHQVRCV